MAKPQTRTALKEYCLRSLGHPVIEVNVDDDQLEDRIDEAIQVWNDYHYDGTERIYLKHQVTQTDIDNEYITVGESTISIIKVHPIESTSSPTNMFDVRYQLRLNEIFDLASTSVLYYNMIQRHLSLIEETLVSNPPLRFNRHTDRIYIDMDWNEDINVDEFLIFEVYRILDPNTYTDVYNDRFLKRYLTALLKYQWGSNLSKFQGVQMPGGVTLDGQRILQEAQEEITKIEEEMQLRFEEPVNMMVG